MVKPDFLLLTNNICNQLTKWYENLAYQLNIPVFFIDTCYNPWDYVTETRVRYVRTQIDQLIKDLCAFTGKTWDEARFKEVMTISPVSYTHLKGQAEANDGGKNQPLNNAHDQFLFHGSHRAEVHLPTHQDKDQRRGHGGQAVHR